jgi:hypothetical protein
MRGELNAVADRNYLMGRIGTRASRALIHIEEQTLIRSGEILGIVYVGQTALRGAAELAISKSELAKVCPPGAEMEMAAIGDALVAAIQGRVLGMMEGL